MVSAAAIICQDEKVLTIRDTAQGMLVLPGGHLHWDEDPETGVRREVREETGYEVEPERLFGVYSAQSGLSDRGIIRVIYEGRITGGTEQSSAEGMVEWLSLATLEQEHARDVEIIREWIDARQ